MLPFDYREIWRYRGNILFFKWIALRYAQMRSFRAADGVIFLTKHAAKVITDAVGRKLQNAVVIPHGVDERFRNPPRKAREIRNLNSKDPFRIIYVSTIDRYKHQWRLVKAIHDLRIETRWPLELYLVGSYERSSFYRLQREIKISDPDKIWAFYLGPAPQDSLVRLYDKCDLAVFISTCENMPNVLLEKMSSGLPIISSSIKANQEILGDTGFYVFSENVVELKAALRKAIESADVRAIAAEKNYVRAFQYDWNRCASSTFAFLREVAATSKWK
jgi:glycosyltransferase involved in cell wall biosynthesis